MLLVCVCVCVLGGATHCNQVYSNDATLIIAHLELFRYEVSQCNLNLLFLRVARDVDNLKR